MHNEIQKDAFDVDGDGQIDRTFLWHDFNARFNDDQLGRWHVPDPILNDFSPYSVNHNNPLIFTDKSGLNPDYPEGWLFAPNTLPEPDIRWIRTRSDESIAPLRGPTGYYSATTNAPYFWSGGMGGSSGSLINRGGGHSGSMGGYWNTVEHPSSASSTGESSYTPPPPPTMAEQEAYGKKQLVELGGKIKDAANSGGGTQSLIPNSDVYLSITGFSWLWGAAAALNEPHFRVDPASIAAGKFIGKIIIGLNVAATAAEGYDLVSNWDQAGQGDVAKFGVDATLTTVTTILYFTGVGAPVAVLLTGIQVANTLGTFDPIYESFNEPIHGGSGSW